MERLGLLDFHTAAKEGKVDVLLVHNLTRLGRDADTVTKYWRQLCDFGVTVHAADCGEIDLSLDTILRGLIVDLRKRP